MVEKIENAALANPRKGRVALDFGGQCPLRVRKKSAGRIPSRRSGPPFPKRTAHQRLLEKWSKRQLGPFNAVGAKQSCGMLEFNGFHKLDPARATSLGWTGPTCVASANSSARLEISPNC
jgi:hypothetical protein